jgi:hypothetical protein
MAAQGIDRLGVLVHQHLTMSEDDGLGLLVGGLDRDRAHGRTRRCLVDRFGVLAVVFAAFEERLYVLRREQSNPMTQLNEQAAPMMRAAARLQHHFSRLQLAEKRLDLATPELAPEHRAILIINAIQRENVFGRIDRNALKHHLGGPRWWLTTQHWHKMPWGRPHQQATK